MSLSKERRRYVRYPVNHLTVTIKSLQHHHHDWDERGVDAIDFNRFGIAIETELNVAVGDVLTMLISTGDQRVAEVEGLVCNRIHTDKGCRLGIRFEYPETGSFTGGQKNISEAILQMEREAVALEC